MKQTPWLKKLVWNELYTLIQCISFLKLILAFAWYELKCCHELLLNWCCSRTSFPKSWWPQPYRQAELFVVVSEWQHVSSWIVPKGQHPQMAMHLSLRFSAQPVTSFLVSTSGKVSQSIALSHSMTFQGRHEEACYGLAQPCDRKTLCCVLDFFTDPRQAEVLVLSVPSEDQGQVRIEYSNSINHDIKF